MVEEDWLTKRFEESRGHLRIVAYRLLGSYTEAEDAVQESWLRLNHADTTHIENLRGWLTTVVARVCLDMLRSRSARREDSLEELAEAAASSKDNKNPEQEALLADAVGLALLVVLDRLNPAERLAFVLHDFFALSFDEISPIVGRSSTATRQLASRARRQIKGGSSLPSVKLTEHRKIVSDFLAALRRGDIEGLIAVLDPDVTVELDEGTEAQELPGMVQGAENWAEQLVAVSRGARFTEPALVDGGIGVVVAPYGRLLRVLRFTITRGKIAKIDSIANLELLQRLKVAVLEGP